MDNKKTRKTTVKTVENNDVKDTVKTVENNDVKDAVKSVENNDVKDAVKDAEKDSILSADNDYKDAVKDAENNAIVSDNATETKSVVVMPTVNDFTAFIHSLDKGKKICDWTIATNLFVLANNKKITENCLYNSDNNFDLIGYASDKFGYSKSTTQNYIAVINSFFTENERNKILSLSNIDVIKASDIKEIIPKDKYGYLFSVSQCMLFNSTVKTHRISFENAIENGTLTTTTTQENMKKLAKSLRGIETKSSDNKSNKSNNDNNNNNNNNNDNTMSIVITDKTTDKDVLEFMMTLLSNIKNEEISDSLKEAIDVAIEHTK